MKNRICLWRKGQFKVYRSAINRGGGKISGEKNGMYGRRGELCPNFKGAGRHKRKDGYYREYDSTCLDNRSLEHRKVVERHLGRKLRLDEIVHHIDGNKSNNAINNLRVMSRPEHSRLHMLKRLGRDSDVKDEAVTI